MGGAATKGSKKSRKEAEVVKAVPEEARDLIREKFEKSPTPKLIELRQRALDVLNDVDDQCTKLELSRLGILQLPDALFKVTNCTALILSYNCLPTLPVELASLSMLEELRVNNNHLTGAVGPDFTLYKMTQLKVLDISWNLLESYDFVSDLTNLTFLAAENCPSMKPDSWPDLSGLTSLTHLDLSRNHLKGLNWQSMPSSLVSLNLSINEEITSLPKPVKKFKKLMNLNLSYTKLDSSTVTDLLLHCPALVHLNLQHTLISEFPDDLLPMMKNIVSLDISVSKLTTFPEVFCPSRSGDSQDLWKRNNRNTGNLTEIQEVEKPATPVEQAWEVPGIPDEAHDPEANLASNDFTEIPDEIAKLSKLTALNLSHNKLTKLPAVLGKMKKLQYLHIDYNPFEDRELIRLYYEHPNASPLLSHLCGEEIKTKLPKNKSPKLEPTTLADSYPSNPLFLIPDGVTKWTKEELVDKLYGLFFGQALGDAIGLASEFLNVMQTSYYYGTEPISFSNFIIDNHRKRWKEADFTDDTDQMLLILEHFLGMKDEVKVKQQEYAESLLRWAYFGFPELGDTGGMGIGSTVSAVLRHPSFLEDPKKAATDVWAVSFSAAANGAVMRTAITGVIQFYDIEKVIKNTLDICHVTHVDPRCQASCVAIAVSIALMLQGEDDTDEIIKKAIEYSLPFLKPSVYKSLGGEKMTDEKADEFSKGHGIQLRTFLQSNIKDLDLGEGAAIGYTYKCAGSGFAALQTSHFATAINKITYQAGDADTNGAVAGAMVGCKVGYKGLPREWVEALTHGHWYKRKVDELLRAMGLI